MVEIQTGVPILDGYNKFLSFFPHSFGVIISLIILIFIIFLYCVLIWKFYRFIAKKNIVDLNLFEYAGEGKFLYGLLYFLEYIVILPLVIFIGFVFFSFLLILLAEESISFGQILLISATIIGVIRLASYFDEDLSREIAKLLPLTLLAVAITQIGFLNPERAITTISNIPSFIGDIFIYFAFIFILESILRIFDLIFLSAGFGED